MSLLRDIERHMRVTGICATQFGRQAVRDPSLVHDLRNGREPGASVTRRVLAFIGAREREQG